MKKNLVVLSIVIVCAVAASFFLFTGGDGYFVDASAAEGSDGKGRSDKRKKARRIKSIKKNTLDRKKVLAQKREERRSAEKSVGDDESNLTPAQRKLLESIEQALDNEDKATLLRLIQQLQQSPGWPGSVPVSIRLAAVEALEWFGASCLPEAVGFLADPDEEVSQSALSQFEDAVEDSDLSDTERSGIMVMASQVVTDTDTLDSMFFELNNMRNSVAVDTIKKLWKNASAAALPPLAEAVESFTGEDGIDTPEKLDAWLRENPDDPE